MNKTEREMVAILTRGRERFGIVSVKAEFEAEARDLKNYFVLLMLLGLQVYQ